MYSSSYFNILEMRASNSPTSNMINESKSSQILEYANDIDVLERSKLDVEKFFRDRKSGEFLWSMVIRPSTSHKQLGLEDIDVVNSFVYRRGKENSTSKSVSLA